MIVGIIISAFAFFWGSALLVKTATGEATKNTAIIQHILAFIMFVIGAWVILVYST